MYRYGIKYTVSKNVLTDCEDPRNDYANIYIFFCFVLFVCFSLAYGVWLVSFWKTK